MKRKLAAMTTVVVSLLFGIVHAEVDVLTPALSEQANSDVAALASQEKINSFAEAESRRFDEPKIFTCLMMGSQREESRFWRENAAVTG